MVRKPHFFKARSRLGMPNLPHGQKKLNIGVEEGADFILTTKFLQNFKNYSLTEFNFPKPEEFNLNNYFSKMISEYKKFAEVINNNFGKDQTQIVIGGDNSVTFASLLAVSERLGDLSSFGYVQFDSHGDMHLFSTSPSKNFHGMYLRAFLDNFDKDEVARVIKKKIKPENCLFVGNLDLEKAEYDFFQNKLLKNINSISFGKNLKQTEKEVSKFIKNFEHIHINFDIDVFNKNIVSATGVPSKKGMFEEEVFFITNILGKHKSLSIDLSEVNPKMRGAKKTIKMAQKVLFSLIL